MNEPNRRAPLPFDPDREPTRHTRRGPKFRDVFGGRESLRREYFAAGANPYGVSFDRLVEHLKLDLARRRAPFGPRPALHLPDLFLAIACLDGDGRARAALRNEHDLVLMQHARRRRDPVDARRALDRLLEALLTERGLARYAGRRPLRAWLIDRLRAALEAEAEGDLNPPLRFPRATGAARS